MTKAPHNEKSAAYNGVSTAYNKINTAYNNITTIHNRESTTYNATTTICNKVSTSYNKVGSAYNDITTAYTYYNQHKAVMAFHSFHTFTVTRYIVQLDIQQFNLRFMFQTYFIKFIPNFYELSFSEFTSSNLTSIVS